MKATLHSHLLQLRFRVVGIGSLTFPFMYVFSFFPYVYLIFMKILFTINISIRILDAEYLRKVKVNYFRCKLTFLRHEGYFPPSHLSFSSPRCLLHFVTFCQYGGTGIGLALAKRFLEMMAGEISVRTF
jgi:hypothetical protein